MKRWNATRWLGRDACLTSFCKALDYILDHLRIAMKDTSLTKATREQAQELYDSITKYDNFLFFFYYREVTAILAHTSRKLQYETFKFLMLDVTLQYYVRSSKLLIQSRLY